MNISELTHSLLIKEVTGNTELEITGIQYDSRKVEKNNLFICLEGHTVDGHEFIPQALEKGAIAFLVQQEVIVPPGITVIKVPDTRRAMAFLADTFYHSPTSQFNAIAITGTNGKTTTSNLIQQILNDNKKKSGLIGTINIQYGDVEITSKNTTPDTLELQQIFHDMLQQDMSHVVMEVSSHALSLGRVRGTKFKTAIFTNLTQDHLDFHANMEDYKQAKGLLFSQLGNAYGEHPSYAVLNSDDPVSKDYAEITPAQVITYGIHQSADVMARDIRLTSKGTTFTVHTFKGSATIETKLIGEFNVSNILAAVATCLIEGISLDAITSSLRKIEGVPGRFELVDAGQDFAVIVDYAHTPDSLENVLKTARKLSTGRLFTVVGCGGNRDATKRPIMAGIAEENSDFVFLTSDNPRNEEPSRILDDMEKGIKGQFGASYTKILDRKEAIKAAVSGNGMPLTEGDCVIIAGKGHETYQIIGANTFHFDDREIARECIDAVQTRAKTN